MRDRQLPTLIRPSEFDHQTPLRNAYAVYDESMNTLVATLRLVVGFGGLTAIIATLLDTLSQTSINPFNFFGYFTMQTNILTVVMLVGTAVFGFAGRTQGRFWQLFRACITTYIVIVGIVYNALLTGTDGGISLAWANVVLHSVIPIYVALDWLLFGDRAALPWSRLWVVVVYPAIWLVVVLIRGATDGWVPYPFLDPALGYGVVAAYCVGIAIAIVLVGALSWWVSRLQLLRAEAQQPAPAR